MTSPQPDCGDAGSLRFASVAVHVGSARIEDAIHTPIVMAKSYLLPEDPADSTPSALSTLTTVHTVYVQ